MNEQRLPGPHGRGDEESARPGLFDEVDFEARQSSWPAADRAQAGRGDDSWQESEAVQRGPPGSGPADVEPPSPSDPGLRAYVESEAVPAEVEAAEAMAESDASPAFAEELEEQEIEPGATPIGAVDEPMPGAQTEPVEPVREAAAVPEVGLEADWEDVRAEAVDVEGVEPAEVEVAAVEAEAVEDEAAEERSVEGRLARLHLRGGLVALARAELETMAGQGTLDGPALADLAEARWRSGDLLGAGEAAQAHIARGGEELMALVVAAEALTAQARTVEARRIAARVVERTAGDLEPLFAGQPRALVWPRDGVTGSTTEGAAWAGLPAETAPAPELTAIAPGRADDAPPVGAEAPESTPDSAAGVAAAAPPPSETEERVAPGRQPASSGELAQRAVARELEAIEWSVEHGHFESLPGRLAIVLQTDRSQAARVLELTETAVELIGGGGELATELLLVSGDAYQVLGRKEDAAAAYRASARAMEGAQPVDSAEVAEVDEPDEPSSPASSFPPAPSSPPAPSTPPGGELEDEAFGRAEQEATAEAAGSSWGSVDEEVAAEPDDAGPDEAARPQTEPQDREPYEPERWQRP